jgi:PKD repeat protein
MLPPVSTPDDSGMLPPMTQIPMRQPVSGTLMVAPPYGNAPLKVGFFVLASDPENIGFLTFQWDFGDGSVSSLPPELYIFHTYATPGNYLCTLVVKTVDGRSLTMMQGVVVVPVQD